MLILLFVLLIFAVCFFCRAGSGRLHLSGDGVSRSGLSSAPPQRGRELSSREAVLPLKCLVREEGLHTRESCGATRLPSPDERAAKRYSQLLIHQNPLRLCLLEIEMAAC